MNYVLAGLSVFIACVSLACYLRYKQETAKVNADEPYKIEKREEESQDKTQVKPEGTKESEF